MGDKMKLGDKVAEVTEALGVKPCEGCKKRQETLNTISRRGIIGGGLLSLLLFKDGSVRFGWKVSAQDPPVTPILASTFMSMGINAQLQRADKTGYYVDRDTMFVDIVSHKEHFDPDSGGYAWMSRFTPGKGAKALDQWTIVFTLVPYSLYPDRFKNGYRFALYNDKMVIISDETGMHYQAPLPDKFPDLSQLTRAELFPGAVPFGSDSH
jgi:hypothetical protein